MSTLVIGGVGFLGSHVVQRLAARETGRVAVLDLSEPPEKERVGNVQYFTGDIRDEQRIVQVLKEVYPSCVHARGPSC
jgi:UDP-glucose 4-epimerase